MYMYIYIYIHMYVCMHVCMCVCMYVYIYIYILYACHICSYTRKSTQIPHCHKHPESILFTNHRAHFISLRHCYANLTDTESETSKLGMVDYMVYLMKHVFFFQRYCIYLHISIFIYIYIYVCVCFDQTWLPSGKLKSRLPLNESFPLQMCHF